MVAYLNYTSARILLLTANVNIFQIVVVIGSADCSSGMIMGSFCKTYV